MDCFQDFCIACDKQVTEGPYCSQACRLAEMEKATGSNPSSPMATSISRLDRVPSATGFTMTSGYFPSTERKQSASYGNMVERSLSPSSSRSSLSSTTSTNSGGNAISKQAKAELHDYFNSFDQTRAAKRRSSVK